MVYRPCHLINQLSDIYLQNHRPLTRLRYIRVHFPAINKLISRDLEIPIIPHPVMKFLFVLWNQKTYYQVHKKQLLAPILSQMKPIHILPFSVLETNIYLAVHTIDFPSDLLVSNIPTIILFALSSPPVCRIPCPSHSP
jgi:hypothetical protein